MFTIHATRKLLIRVRAIPLDLIEKPSTKMGNWYANLVPGTPQTALFVNESTLVPVLMPLARPRRWPHASPTNSPRSWLR